MPLYFFYLYDGTSCGFDDRLVEADSIDHAVEKARSIIAETAWFKIEIMSAYKDSKVLRRVVTEGIQEVEFRNEVI